MSENKPVYIISDSPEAESLSFGFEAYSKTISDLIAYKENKTPLVIGVYGKWGSGKTTLMKSVKSSLENGDYKDREIYRKCKTVWFQAWKYNKEEEILAALIEEIFKTMEKDNFFEQCKAEIEKLTKKLDKSKIAGTLTKLFTGIDVTEFFQELDYKDKLGFYDTFQNFFDDILWTYLNWRAKLTDTEEPDDTKGALVVFIDDLDRCPKPRIIKVLETIKLFMDKEGCIFVIGAANEIIESALEDIYGNDAGQFMDKIVQVTFNLPHINHDEFEPFLEKLSSHLANGITEHLQIILPSMQNNPRRLKRFMNNMSLQQGLLRNKAVDIEYKHLLLWNIIDYAYHALKKDIIDNIEVFYTLQDSIKELRNIRELNSIDKESNGFDFNDEIPKTIPESLHIYMRNKDLVKIIQNFDCDRQTLKQLISMNSIVENFEDAKDKKAVEHKTHKESMARIESGEFLFGDEKEKKLIEKPYFIDIYPVTNEEYGKFIGAGGYFEKDYWSQKGKEWLTKKVVSQPKFWGHERYSERDQPVVGVSYYEAEAYAAWVGKRLPTEEEWERAARGVDGREFPWGNTFDKEKCNTNESGVRRPNRVSVYPNGVSPEGCYDMAGNVWEWTSSFYNEAKDSFALRGGSWALENDYCSCTFRDRSRPGEHFDTVGFRCVML